MINTIFHYEYRYKLSDNTGSSRGAYAFCLVSALVGENPAWAWPAKSIPTTAKTEPATSLQLNLQALQGAERVETQVQERTLNDISHQADRSPSVNWYSCNLLHSKEPTIYNPETSADLRSSHRHSSWPTCCADARQISCEGPLTRLA